MINSRRMNWAVHATRIQDRKNLIGGLEGVSPGKKSFEDASIILKWILNK
jgi:hypothetical protein